MPRFRAEPLEARVTERAHRSQHARSMSSYNEFYAVARQIPSDRVTTYGVVATAGLPGRAQQVGYAISALPHVHDVPLHRVINARDEVSPRSGGSAFEQIQRKFLEAESIEFDALGRIDLDRFSWP